MYLSFGGKVGKDPELRNAGNSTVLNFSVAVNGYDRSARQKTTTWIRVAVWGKRGEQLGELVRKGESVSVTGAFSTREYNGKTYLEVTAQDVTLLGGGSRESEGGDDYDDAPPARQQQRQQQRSASQPRTSTSRKPTDDDDDIPF